ncbi:uncharacterized protein LOC128174775 [Crassostrea angulata]|uniref:uncharacterized protein LOC128174775 n=1 Tax=Magallana angulata TaxID=2784310 RepID=UPI0022B101FA|nr:uncharacterized protein LOC128174775 [Crassostrea angulata]
MQLEGEHSKKECERYNYTTTGKTTEEENGIEEEIMAKRKPKKRIFSDFIFEGVKSTEEESCGAGTFLQKGEDFELVAAVTEQVLQALSNENKRGEKRTKRQQKGSDSKRQRAPSSSGTDSGSNEESSSDSDSSSSSESDSDLLSDSATSQI